VQARSVRAIVPIFLVLLLPVWALVASPDYAAVAPIFAARCVVCYKDGQAPRGLRLDSYGGLLRGNQRGPVVAPGAPDSSELVRRIEGKSQPRMPFDGPPYLSDDEIRLIGAWIAAGTPDDAGSRAPAPAGRAGG
jgi:hypothetical protein